MNQLAQKRIAERYIPRGYEPEHMGDHVHIYFGDNSEVAKELNFKEIQYYAIAFKAQGKNSIAHIRFSSRERRDDWARELVGQYVNQAREKLARRNAGNDHTM